MQQFEETFPFLSVVKFLDKEYVGIIGNTDSNFTSIYIMDTIHDERMKSFFIECCNEWWWETNRQIPINIALRDKWMIFKPYMKLFSTKDLQILYGYKPPIENPINKKSKKRQVELIKRV